MVEASPEDIEDMEDLYLSKQSLLHVMAGTERTYTSAEVGVLLDLED